jgi:hydroxyethylthiazole kinase-like uncharacterized protein yjeF
MRHHGDLGAAGRISAPAPVFCATWRDLGRIESGGAAMTELLTTAQMRAVERAAMDAGVASGLDLMERAGAAVVEATLAARPGLAGGAHRAVVLCGPGANGGDGYVVARLLHARGWRVEALGLGDPARAPADAAEARRRWEAAGPVRPLGALAGALTGADLLVDALFGAGLARALPQAAEAAFAAAGGSDASGAGGGGPFRVAVDAPSGLCLDTGRARGAVRPADLTVTFHRARPGHHVEEGPALCGRLVVADIGLEPFAETARGVRHALVDRPTAGLAKAVRAHKYDHGHVLVLAGGPGRGGAARLAARAALRVGAGLVTVGAPAAAMAENASRLDAVMLRRIDRPEALAEALGDPRINALVIGPGLGVGPATRALVEVALAAAPPRAVVLDADALTTLAADGALRAARPGALVMTPHLGEFRRLFPRHATGWGPDDAAELSGKTHAARAAAEALGAVMLLKGPDTVISDGRRVSIHAASGARAAPWLATAGAGDVLAGLIGGLLARGVAPMAAAETAAWLHVEAGRAAGPGLIAEDLPEALPAVLRGLGA